MTAIPWEPGQPVGRYLLLGKLAQGGMAEIWLARQTGAHGFEKVVVVKRLIDPDENFSRMLMDEARIASHLDHPHIVHIYDLGDEDGSLFIAMEYLAGSPLNHVLETARRQGKDFPFRFSVRLVAWAAEALAYAHTKTGYDGKPMNIVHRDVSPQNLVVLYDGNVKLVDFGIAKATNRLTQTAENMFKGKLHYASPEQVKGMEADARSDIFSLGVVLFEATTGTHLMKIDDPARVVAILADSSTPMTRASQVLPGFPSELDDIIAKALEKDRNARFPSAHAFQKALELWLRNQPPVGTTDIAACMHELFASRIEEREDMIDAALKGLSDTGARKLLEKFKSDPGSATTVASSEQHAPAGSKRVILSWVAGVAIAGGLLTWGAVEVMAPPRLEPVAPPISAPTPPPPVAQTRLAVASDPPGSEVFVDGESRGVSPIEIVPIGVGRHTLEVKREGYDTAKRSVEITEAGTRLEVLVPLVEAATPKAPAVESPKPTTPKSIGFVNIDSQPWCSVYLGDRKLGETPLIHVAVPAGKIKLTLRNEEAGLKRVVEVDVQPGKTTTSHLRF